ncbi:MAG: ABC transporter permease subunit [Oscillospiraceae bacterium]|jgi:arabinogalactan oligomer/maltooligosaccharide transport system permease protein|nr:ABC transporter permease subunit [Oscillospiraceae bacterium]
MAVRPKELGPKKRFAQVVIYFELIVVLVIVLIPVLWIFSTSFSKTNSVSDLNLIPRNFTTLNYKEIFTETDFAKWYRNTFIVAVLTMIATIIVNAFTAFIFARFPFKGRKPLLMFIMLFSMFPSFLALTAIYVICLNFNLLNNIYTLVIIYTAGSIPGNIFLVRGYLLNIPRTLDEAAFIDGASKLQVFWRVVMPLASPILAFIAVTSFMGPWFDFILPRMLISANEKTTVALGLFKFVNPQDPSYNVNYFAAASMIVATPIAALQMGFQRFLVTGITAGANKGE